MKMRPIYMPTAKSQPTSPLNGYTPYNSRNGSSIDNFEVVNGGITSLISKFETNPSKNYALRKSKSFSNLTTKKAKSSYGKTQDDFLHDRKEVVEDRPVAVRDLLRKFENGDGANKKSKATEENKSAFEDLEIEVKNTINELKEFTTKWKEQIENILLNNNEDKNRVSQLQNFLNAELGSLSEGFANNQRPEEERITLNGEASLGPNVKEIKNKYENKENGDFQEKQSYPKTPDSTPTEEDSVLTSARMITNFFNNLNKNKSEYNLSPKVKQGNVKDLSLVFDPELKKDHEEDCTEQPFSEKTEEVYNEYIPETYEIKPEGDIQRQTSVKELASIYDPELRKEAPKVINEENISEDNEPIQGKIRNLATKYEQTDVILTATEESSNNTAEELLNENSAELISNDTPEDNHADQKSTEYENNVEEENFEDSDDEETNNTEPPAIIRQVILEEPENDAENTQGDMAVVEIEESPAIQTNEVEGLQNFEHGVVQNDANDEQNENNVENIIIDAENNEGSDNCKQTVFSLESEINDYQQDSEQSPETNSIYENKSEDYTEDEYKSASNAQVNEETTIPNEIRIVPLPELESENTDQQRSVDEDSDDIKMQQAVVEEVLPTKQHINIEEAEPNIADVTERLLLHERELYS